jgi:hypothetical protein
MLKGQRVAGVLMLDWTGMIEEWNARLVSYTIILIY